ncbi:MAG: xanthine dehydrogenase accessory protein XdhC, partial [Rhodobacteraceae bacterium]|nr:xanthine dehydrogenase accessory protein XdhC [Paracoccaceae bacterium]
MSFDLVALRDAVALETRVARVVVADLQGSGPREIGAAMLVWEYGQSGTIGGGALEFEAVERARDALNGGRDRIDRYPLGPALGQCCGGAVRLLTEIYDAKRLETLDAEVIARPVIGGAEMPLAVIRLLSRARSQGTGVAPQLVAGWMVEPVRRATRPLWIYGAG